MPANNRGSLGTAAPHDISDVALPPSLSHVTAILEPTIIRVAVRSVGAILLVTVSLSDFFLST